MDDAALPPTPAADPQAAPRTRPPDAPTTAAPDPYAPRRRYPWHDDPHYDPTAYRRPPGATAPSWPPPQPDPFASPTNFGGPPPHAAIEAARSRVISAILARRKVVSFPGDTVRAGSRYVLWMKRR